MKKKIVKKSKKSTKNSKRLKVKKISRYRKYKKYLPILLVVLIVLTGISFFLFRAFSGRENPKPVVETLRSEVKRLPREIKRKLAEITPTAVLRVPILMYHYVEYVQDKRDTIRQSLNVDPDIFESQIKTLRDGGYTFMTAKELGDVLDGKIALPNNPILLTFDDGHWDFYSDVLPILKKYHVKATAYIIPGFIGGSDFMTKQEIEAVRDSGLVDIGAHTVHHISLKGLPLSEVKYEVDTSKTMLEDKYHIHVVSFAYPNGSFDEQAVDVVKDAGFTTSVSTVPGVEQTLGNRYFLFRLRPSRRTGAFLLDWLQQNEFSPY